MLWYNEREYKLINIWRKGVKGLTDKFSKEKRSEIMSKIRGRDTEIELLVRRWLFSRGFRFRKNDRRYPGTPDLILPKYKTAIFIHGCFWHFHQNCKHGKIPDTRSEFWSEKFKRNTERDLKKIEALEYLGWKVIVLWECQLMKEPEIYLHKVEKELRVN